MSIIKLRSDDFFIENGTKGPILCNGIKGLALTMFWSPNCNICRSLEPLFRRLPQMINNCKFCFLNINENQNIIGLSKETIAPIEFVPYIVFYVNGRPFLQYDDEPTLDRLASFVQYATKLIESKKAFIDKGAKIVSDIPAYSIAKPYADFKCNDDGFCYLTYKEAYGKTKANNNQRK